MAIIVPKHVAENIDRFTGRTWLLPRILEWWDHSDERLLLMTGGPGTGKSMILAWLSDFGPQLQDATAQARDLLTHCSQLSKRGCRSQRRELSGRWPPEALSPGSQSVGLIWVPSATNRVSIEHLLSR
jgi:hypothetical protein